MRYSLFPMEEKRLSKALAAAGIASRRGAEKLIFAGRVLVNGALVDKPQHPITLGVDEVLVDGKKVFSEQKKVYYLLNKPKGYLCSSVRPAKSKKIVLDLFPQETKRLFSVGRLDKDTEGLLLVTNDGHFANRVIHPSSNIIKEYLVKTDREIGPEHLETLSQGAQIDRKWVRPTSVKKVRKGTFRISVKEGKKHEVRLIAEKASLKVLALRRIRIGSLTLGNLPLGEYRALSEKEKNLLFC